MGLVSKTPIMNRGFQALKAGQPGGVLIPYDPKVRRKVKQTELISHGAIPEARFLEELQNCPRDGLEELFQRYATSLSIGKRDILVYEAVGDGQAEIIACANTGQLASDIFAYAPMLEKFGLEAAEAEVTYRQKKCDDGIPLSINEDVFARLYLSTVPDKKPTTRRRFVVITANSDSESFLLSKELNARYRGENEDLKADNKTLQSESVTDALTKLPNRKMSKCVFRKIIGRSRRRETGTKEFVTVLMIDADHFKAINDSLGHCAGDKVLKHIAETLNGLKREADYLSRHGGEEFLFIGYNRSMRKAFQLARRIQTAFVDKPCCLMDGTFVPFSISVGMYTFDPEKENVVFSVAADRADTALYRAKREGRNCVRGYWPPMISRLDKRYQPA